MWRMGNRPDPFERPLDALLERLRVHGLDYRPAKAWDTWTATCPVCGNSMLLRERFRGAAVELNCIWGGCHESRIVAALAEPPGISGEDALQLAEGLSAVAHRALALLEGVPSCQ
jgi:hypothetical protein